MTFFLFLFSILILFIAVLVGKAIDIEKKKKQELENAEKDRNEQACIDKIARRILRILYDCKDSHPNGIEKIKLMEIMEVSIPNMKKAFQYLSHRKLASVTETHLIILEFGIDVVKNFEI
jgi:hypothetical protein